MSTYLPAVFSTVRPDAFDRQIDHMFEEALSAFGSAGGAWVPACNAWDDSNGFYIQMALPGWEPKDVALEVNDNMLCVKGQRTEETTNSRKHLMREIADGRFGPDLQAADERQPGQGFRKLQERPADDFVSEA